MELPPVVTRRRHLDDIAEGLPHRAGALSRLFLAQSRLGISRIEAGVMGAVSQRPQRITELAAAEGVTQPAITRLVDRLQERRWVTREHHPEDGRVVMVRLTNEGEAMLGELRAEYRSLLHEEMAVLP